MEASKRAVSGCRESNEEKQLNQWAKCLDQIEQYEKLKHFKFDAVVKLRPDDIWYFKQNNNTIFQQ
jgi:hypothetical protein